MEKRFNKAIVPRYRSKLFKYFNAVQLGGHMNNVLDGDEKFTPIRFNEEGLVFGL